MELSKRLSAVAGLVSKGNNLVDVGTDHAYLPLWLVTKGICPKAIAMDVRPGPLSRAREHVRTYEMEERIETRMGDGLSPLTYEEISVQEGDPAWTLVISGMGGLLMERILSDREDIVRLFSEAILQPQSDIPHFRRFLHEYKLAITEERMVLEDGKFYPIMKVVPMKTPYTLEELFGEKLLAEKNPVLKQYLERESRINSQILESLTGTRSEIGENRRKEILLYQQQVNEALAYYSRG